MCLLVTSADICTYLHFSVFNFIYHSCRCILLLQASPNGNTVANDFELEYTLNAGCVSIRDSTPFIEFLAGPSRLTLRALKMTLLAAL